MLSLVIAESALGLVPKELQNHNSVTASARRFNKRPSEILLDVSWHYAAMKGMKNELKMGRPDLVHFCLLEACSIPLFFENNLDVFVHTADNSTIFFDRSVRLPKSYHRFAGLMEKLFSEGKIEEGGRRLIELKRMDFGELVETIRPKQVIGLSTSGMPSSYQNLGEMAGRDACIIVGGFAKGHFSENVSQHFDAMLSVDRRPLEAHIIISRALYECEKRILPS
ncbi:MAG: ribosome biogenesis protein [Thaumarchaeota archaeon]|nr:ribosome biogenesis protein [Nitrososphaerota archaeon]